MGCSASDLDEKQEINTVNNVSWSSYNFGDAHVGGKKYIFYKTKRHKKIICLKSWLRRLNICVYIDDRPDINTSIDDNEELINMIIPYITYSAEYENEGNKNERLIIESNTVVVLPSNGKRIYEFKSLHIHSFGVLTVTKWIDCDYHNNIGGVLKIHCHENIVIDKHGMINLNGAGLTGLETDDVLTRYCGYSQITKNYSENNDIDDDIEDEKANELNIEKTISKPNIYDFKNYYISKGGSYFKTDKKNKNRNKRRNKNKIYYGGIGGGCIMLKCNDFINDGFVISNGTNKPIKINQNSNNNREILSKFKYFANNGSQEYSGFNIKVIDVGIDGTGGFIAIHIKNQFVNKGLIEAVNFGDIIIVHTTESGDNDRKLEFGKCNPFPKAQGFCNFEKEIPTDELL